jgi:hypothetical protein
VEEFSGWVKIWRAILRNPLYRAMSGRERNVLITCVLLANWQDRKWFCKVLGQEVIIPRGSFVATQASIGEEANDTRKVVRGALEKMTGGRFIRIRPLEQLLDEGVSEGVSDFRQKKARVQRRVSLYVVVNYCKWQDEGQTRANDGATRGPLEGPDLRRIKKGKKEKKDLQPSLFTASEKKKKAKRPGTAILQEYYDQYQALHGTPPEGITWAGRDLQVAESLLKGPPPLTPEQLAERIHAYLRLDDDYVQAAGFPFALLPSRLGKLAKCKLNDSNHIPEADPNG